MLNINNSLPSNSNHLIQDKNPTHDFRLNTFWLFIGLIAPLVVNAVLCAPKLYLNWISPDTTIFYFPFAQRLSENFWAFFSHSDSLWTAPGTSIYMAIAGLTYESIKTTNFALSFLVLLMIFDGSLRLGGPIAAAAAAWLYAIYPPLIDYKVAILSEAPFVFLTTLYFWLCICATNKSGQSQFYVRKISLLAPNIVIAGLALGAATLTRGAYLYWIPFAILGTAGACLFTKNNNTRTLLIRLLTIHIIAGFLVLSYLSHVYLNFGKFFIANGSGAALYLGSNPITGGFEPPYMGLNYDVWTMEEGSHHLTDGSERNLLAAAKASLSDTSLVNLLSMYKNKVGAFLFFSKAHLVTEVGNERSWRIALLILAFLGVLRNRTNPIVLIFAGIIVYMVSVHTPLLYTARYSIGSIDIILILLSGLGLASCFREGKWQGKFAAMLAMILVGIFLGQVHQRYSSPVMPDISRGANSLISSAAIEKIQTQGTRGHPFLAPSEAVTEIQTIVWGDFYIHRPGISIINISKAYIGSECRDLRVVFIREDKVSFEKTINIRNLPSGGNIGIGTAAFISSGSSKGDMHFHFNCPIGSSLRFGELALYHGSIGLLYREGLLSK